MNFDVLYSIAIDLINKKRANNWNFSHSDFVCVLMSESNNIFTGMSVSDIKNGKLVSSCAEYETIKVMMGSNETKIKAMATVNVSSLMPALPCDDCKKLIVEVNPENSDCMIMKPDNTFCALKDIGTDVNDDVWGMGWDDDDGFGAGASVGTATGASANMDAFSPNVSATQFTTATDTSNTDNPMPNNPVAPNKLGTASVYTSRYVDNPMPNNPMNPNMVATAYNSSMYSRYNPMPNSPISPNMVGSSMYNSNYINSNYMNPLQNAPMNQPAINMGNSSTLKAVSIDFNPLAYQNENANKENTSTLQTVSLKQSGTLNQQQQPTEASKNVFKERLKNIIADDELMEDDETTPTAESEPLEEVTSKPHRFGKPKDKDKEKDKSKDKEKSKEKAKDKEPEKVSTNGLSKKELKALAKEKKKQAKKNSKILEAMEKQQKK